MKKILLTALVAIFTLTASAQVYVGGSAALWRDYNANETTFKLIPEIGYNLSDQWAIGVEIGYLHNYDNGTKSNGVTIAPYARYTALQWGAVRLFFDGGFGFNTYKTKWEVGNKTVKSDPYNAWEIGIKPGLAVSLGKNIDFVAHLGFLGYRDSDDKARTFGRDGLGFDFDANNLSFGLNYKF